VPMVAAGIGAPSALEQIADHAVVGRGRESRFPMKEPDRRRPRPEGLRRCAAGAQVAQEGRDDGRMGPQGFAPEGFRVVSELPPAGGVAAPGIFGGGAGDERARGRDGPRDGWSVADGGTSITPDPFARGRSVSWVALLLYADVLGAAAPTSPGCLRLRRDTANDTMVEWG
jgi:hypothetical protein